MDDVVFSLLKNKGLWGPTRPWLLGGTIALIDVLTSKFLSALILASCGSPMAVLHKLLGFHDVDYPELVQAVMESGCSFQELIAAYLHNMKMQCEEQQTSLDLSVVTHACAGDLVALKARELLSELARASVKGCGTMEGAKKNQIGSSTSFIPCPVSPAESVCNTGALVYSSTGNGQLQPSVIVPVQAASLPLQSGMQTADFLQCAVPNPSGYSNVILQGHSFQQAAWHRDDYTTSDTSTVSDNRGPQGLGQEMSSLGMKMVPAWAVNPVMHQEPVGWTVVNMVPHTLCMTQVPLPMSGP